MTTKISRPRDIRVIAVSRLISEMGDEIALIALLFRVKSSGPTAISAIFALFAISRIFLSPLSGSVVDRFASRRLITGVSILQTVLSVCLAFSHGLTLYIFVALLAVGGSIIAPAWQALIPELVSADELSRTYAFIQTYRSFAIVIGAGFGGFFVDHFGTSAALLADAATFAVVGILGATLQRQRAPGLTPISRRDSLQGFKTLLSSPVLVASLVLLAAFNMSAGVSEVLGVFLVTDVLGGSAAQYGLIMSSLGLSMVLTGFLLSRLSMKWRDTNLLIVSAFVSGTGMFAYALSPNVYFAMGAFALNGVGLTGLHVFGMPIIVRHTAEDERGRVFSASSSVTTAGTLLSTGIAGSIGLHFPVRLTISIAAITCAVCTLFAGSKIISADKSKQIDF